MVRGLKISTKGTPQWKWIVFIASLGIAASSSNGGEWVYSYPQIGHSAHSCWLALDNYDNPALCYKAPSGIYYTWFDGSVWNETLVDASPDAGDGCKLFLDDTDSPQLIYCDTGFYNVRYAWHDGSDWLAENVWDDLGTKFDMAFDSNGIPHVSFTDNSPPCSLFYGVRSDTGWVIENVGIAGNMPNAIDLDDQDSPHILYHGGGLTHAWLDGSVWETETYPITQAVDDIEMTIDEAGNLHAAIIGMYDLIYAERTGAGWQAASIDTVTGNGCDIAVSGEGIVHIAYEDKFSNDLRYARRDSSGWNVEILNSENYCGLSPSLVLDAFGNPHVLHSMWGALELVSWVPDSLSIEEDSFQQPRSVSLSLSSNPVSTGGVVSGFVRDAGLYSLVLYDVSGRRIVNLQDGWLTQGGHSFPLDAGGLAEGVYFLRLTGAGEHAEESFVILR
jgi:hypothetical protein